MASSCDDAPRRSIGVLHYCRLGSMEPIRKPRILVDACHGSCVDRVYRDAVRGGAARPSSLVHYKGYGGTREDVSPDRADASNLIGYQHTNRPWGRRRQPRHGFLIAAPNRQMSAYGRTEPAASD